MPPANSTRPRRACRARGACSARRRSSSSSTRASTSGSPPGPRRPRSSASFARSTGHRHALLVNSGSSANLLALTALTSPRLRDRRLRPGDEVITVAAGFPTTVKPIVQNGLVPVFVDVTLPTYNIDVDQLEAAVSDRTRAVMLAHTLGNPFDLDAVTEFCQAHDLWLVEDNCDALGSPWHGRTSGPSATSPRSRSIPRTTSRSARAARCSPTGRAEEDRRVDPRLGPRLLVRAGRREHLRQALPASSSARCRTATTTSTSTPTSATT